MNEAERLKRHRESMRRLRARQPGYGKCESCGELKAVIRAHYCPVCRAAALAARREKWREAKARARAAT